MMFEAGVHPTLAGVLVGLLTPVIERHGELTPRAARYRDRLQPLSALVALPIFAMFATGVHFDAFTPALLVSPIVMGILIALVVGKPLGIMATSWICTHIARLDLPEGLRVRDLFPMSCACGIGFTVSFLIASLAYGDAVMVAESRIGILLASLLSAAISGGLLHRQSRRYERTLAQPESGALIR
jgi:NhaA family Na+:H+ antiporter